VEKWIKTLGLIVALVAGEVRQIEGGSQTIRTRYISYLFKN
jgi:hypothetical protein